MVFINLCVLVLWTKVALALEELKYEYQHDRVYMVFINLCVLVLWTKVALALEELKSEYQHDRVLDGFHKSLRSCALDISSLSIGGDKI